MTDRLSATTCCNHNCRQGRDCPNRMSGPTTVLNLLIAAAVLTVLTMTATKIAMNIEHEITNVEREW